MPLTFRTAAEMCRTVPAVSSTNTLMCLELVFDLLAARRRRQSFPLASHRSFPVSPDCRIIPSGSRLAQSLTVPVGFRTVGISASSSIRGDFPSSVTGRGGLTDPWPYLFSPSWSCNACIPDLAYGGSYAT